MFQVVQAFQVFQVFPAFHVLHLHQELQLFQRPNVFDLLPSLNV